MNKQKRHLALSKEVRPTRRDEAGFQLVELLVSVVVSGIIVTAISAGLMKMMNFASHGQNQLMAADIAQEVIDNARNMSFNKLLDLCDAPQPITLLVNRKSASDVPDAWGAFPRPLGQDWVNLDYYQDTPGGLSKSQTNRFRGDASDGGLVQQRMTKTEDAATGVKTVTIQVEVTWLDGRNGRHSYSTSTLIADKGIHN